MKGFGQVCVLQLALVWSWTALAAVSSPPLSLGDPSRPLERRRVVVAEDEPVTRVAKVMGPYSKARCFQYTWMGPENELTNTTTSCGNLNQKGIPCFTPFVWTSGPNSGNQPETADIVAFCQGQPGNNNGTGGTVASCDPFCAKNDDVCIKVTHFLRDSARTVVNTTSFCGKGIDKTNSGASIKNSCFLEKNKGGSGVDMEACFCNNDLCNRGGPGLWPSPLALALALLVPSAMR